MGFGGCALWPPTKSVSWVDGAHVARAGYVTCSRWWQRWLQVVSPSSRCPALLGFAIPVALLVSLWDCPASQMSTVIQMNNSSLWLSGKHQLQFTLLVQSTSLKRLSPVEEPKDCGMRMKWAVANCGGGQAEQPPKTDSVTYLYPTSGDLQPRTAALASY